jgi:hypothetical protein
MAFLGDVGRVKARFGLFGDSFNLSARYAHGSMNVPWAW